MFDGLPRLQPMTPQPQDWENLASKGQDPIIKDGMIRSEPVFLPVDGSIGTLDTRDDVANREAARDGLARSLEEHAKLSPKEADGLVSALFSQPHPTEVDRKILDPGMRRVATSLFKNPDCARHLSSFTQLDVDDQKR